MADSGSDAATVRSILQHLVEQQERGRPARDVLREFAERRQQYRARAERSPDKPRPTRAGAPGPGGRTASPIRERQHRS
jgi:hypothetical protein